MPTMPIDLEKSFGRYLNTLTWPNVVHCRFLFLFSKATDVVGFSALHYASWYCRERIAQFLLSFDIDPNQSGSVGDRPLHIGKI